jgi:hypothetical protein
LIASLCQRIGWRQAAASLNAVAENSPVVRQGLTSSAAAAMVQNYMFRQSNARSAIAKLSIAAAAAIILILPNATAAQEQRPHLWFFSQGGFQRILQVDRGWLSTSLNGPNTSVANEDALIAQARLHVTARHQYRAFADFQADAGNALPEKIVVYNLENRAQTPDNETRDPVSATRDFAALAHSEGKAVLIAPSCGLLRTMTGQMTGVGPNPRCVALILVPVSRYVDIIDFQVQSKERDPAAYENIVRYAVAQTKAAHPNVKVVVQLSTAARLGSTPESLAECARSVADVVDGYWLFVEPTQEGATEADQFLKLMFYGSR